MFVEVLNCRIMRIPFTYLGLPVGANPRRVETWTPVIEKVKKKLCAWKQKQLSIGGRMCLIRSVLSAVPLYYLSFFKAPKKIINTLNSLQRNFLWGAMEEGRKLAWVKWSNCCLPKDKGGLGIKDTESFNIALVGKWLWRLLIEKDALWARVIEAKYGGSRD